MQAPHGLPFIAGCKIGLDDRAQPEALRYFEQLWEEMWPQVLNQSFAATFVIEMMGAGLRYLCIHLILVVHLRCHIIVLHVLLAVCK